MSRTSIADAEAEDFRNNLDKVDELIELFEPLIKQYEAGLVGRFFIGIFTALLFALCLMLEGSFWKTVPFWIIIVMVVVAMFLGAVAGQSLGRHRYAVEAEEARRKILDMIHVDEDARILLDEIFDDDEPDYYRKVVRQVVNDYEKEFAAENGP